MKKLFSINILLLMMLCCTTADKTAGNTKYVKYGKPISINNYMLYEFGNWSAHWDDAENYDVNCYFTLDNAEYFDANTIIFFYYVEDKSEPLKDIVLTDKGNFFTEYPGIKISNFDLGEIDYSVVDENQVKGKFRNKIYSAVMYDFSNVTVKHAEQYQIVVFFKFESDSPSFCVLEIASTDNEAFKYVEDFKKIFLALSENIDSGIQ